MKIEDTFCILVGAYYGIRELDEYKLKEYVLQSIEDLIMNFVRENKRADYKDLSFEVEKLPLKKKLQDCLIVLPKMDVSMEVLFLVKEKIRNMNESERMD